MNAAVWESSADPTGTVWFSVVTDSSSVPEATDETLWEPQSSTPSFTLIKEQELINEDEIILKKIIKTLRKQHSDVEGNISAVEEKE